VCHVCCVCRVCRVCFEGNTHNVSHVCTLCDLCDACNVCIVVECNVLMHAMYVMYLMDPRCVMILMKAKLLAHDEPVVQSTAAFGLCLIHDMLDAHCLKLKRSGWPWRPHPRLTLFSSLGAKGRPAHVHPLTSAVATRAEAALAPCGSASASAVQAAVCPGRQGLAAGSSSTTYHAVQAPAPCPTSARTPLMAKALCSASCNFNPCKRPTQPHAT
jgi:hypothetical protein